MKFHPLKVLEVKPETEYAVAVTFNVPEDLNQEFSYLPGQYLTLKFTLNGEEQRRAYSMCSSPIEENITIGVKRVENGLVSNHINDHVKEGGSIEIMPPQGNFRVACQEEQQKKYILFGGGSGITPLLSIAKTVMSKEPKSSVKLLYANERLDTVMFKSQIDTLQENYSNRFKVEHIINNPPTDWQGKRGLLDTDTIKAAVQELGTQFNAAECYICGPSGMMGLVENELVSLNFPTEKIHIERFTAAKSDSAKAAEINTSTQEAKAKINFFGEEKNILVPKGTSILQALQNQGIDAPFSCQSGVCSTCIALLKKGEVAMEFTEALDDDEIKEGLILTCQAKCITDEVEVIFEH